MVRETIEAHAPTGTLPSEEIVLQLRGPEMTDEAEAICAALSETLKARGGN